LDNRLRCSTSAGVADSCFADYRKPQLVGRLLWNGQMATRRVHERRNTGSPDLLRQQLPGLGQYLVSMIRQLEFHYYLAHTVVSILVAAQTLYT
jgi:hypothetical protein